MGDWNDNFYTDLENKGLVIYCRYGRDNDRKCENLFWEPKTVTMQSTQEPVMNNTYNFKIGDKMFCIHRK